MVTRKFRNRGWSDSWGAGLLALLLSSPAALAIKDGDKFDDWIAKCEKIPEKTDGDQCFIFQTLVDENAKQPVLQTVVGYLKNEKPAIIFTVPLGVALRAGVQVQIDDGETMDVGFEQCNPVGCVAGLPLDDKLLGNLKRGLSGKVTVVDGTGRRIALQISLKGFTAGFAALTAEE